ncbi:hypothetical protein RIF29_03870 [Crotalaria pallida]|uniref:Uncharacterized protein n=1 Tax=Crotalaria pallida TaxID=3830 RepID=A0AAN9J157_CROPI
MMLISVNEMDTDVENEYENVLYLLPGCMLLLFLNILPIPMDPVKFTFDIRDEGRWEVNYRGWEWRGVTEVRIFDPNHTLQGTAPDARTCRFVLADLQTGGPVDYHGGHPMPLPAWIDPEAEELEVLDETLDDLPDEAFEAMQEDEPEEDPEEDPDEDLDYPEAEVYEFDPSEAPPVDPSASS